MGAIELQPIAFAETYFAILLQLVPAIARLDPYLQMMIAGLLAEAGWPGAELGLTYVLPKNVGGVMQYAQRLLGTDGGAARWKQLRDVNVGRFEPNANGGSGAEFSIGADGNLSPLQPGFTLLVPDSWYPAISERLAAGMTIPGLHVPPIDTIGPAPGGVEIPVIPPGGPELSAAALIQAQAMLAAWGKSSGKISPADYGTDPRDFTGIEDPRTQAATKSFQAWANATRSAGLRIDGHLDERTRAELSAVVAEILAATPGGAAVPGVPTPGGQGSKPAEKSSGSSGALFIAALGLGATLLK